MVKGEERASIYRDKSQRIMEMTHEADGWGGKNKQDRILEKSRSVFVRARKRVHVYALWGSLCKIFRQKLWGRDLISPDTDVTLHSVSRVPIRHFSRLSALRECTYRREISRVDELAARRASQSRHN